MKRTNLTHNLEHTIHCLDSDLVVVNREVNRLSKILSDATKLPNVYLRSVESTKGDYLIFDFYCPDVNDINVPARRYIHDEYILKYNEALRRRHELQRKLDDAQKLLSLSNSASTIIYWDVTITVDNNKR